MNVAQDQTLPVHRAHRPRGLRTWRVLVPLVAAVTAVAAGGTYVLVTADAAATCAPDERVLQVAAAPEIAPVVADLLEPAAAGEDGCDRTEVQAVDPADVAAAPAGTGAGTQDAGTQDAPTPDVWVPDSSAWLQGTAAAVEAPSLAVSPVVLALVGPADDDATDVASLLTSADADGTGTRRLVLPDPAVSLPAASLVTSLTTSADLDPRLRSALTRTLREAVPTHAGTTQVMLGGLTADHVVPTSEQAVWAHNATGTATLSAVYGTDPSVLDYPFAVLTDDPDLRARAAELLELLQGPTGATALLSQGFRGPDGGFGADPAAPGGIRADLPVAPTPVPDEAAQQAADVLATLALGSQVLAVIDVSGSMAARVDGGPRRLDLVKQAATAALQVFPTGSSVGLWTFATGAPDGRDHRELVPIGALDEQVNGTPRASLLASALQTTNAVPDGGTPLYDTTLAAVRTLREQWDPRRVNSVVLLTDGRNEDDDSISIDELLQALTAEADPTRPVPVITIAYGPEADAAALARIAEATQGAAYLSPEPHDVDDVFLDAVGRRVCRSTC